MLDFAIYEGAKTMFGESNLGLGPSVILSLAKSIPPGSCVYHDRYFTTVPLIEEMEKLNLHSTEHEREIAVSTVIVQRVTVLVVHSPLNPFHQPDPTVLGVLFHPERPAMNLVTPLRLRVSMVGDDHLLTPLWLACPATMLQEKLKIHLLIASSE
ncbi:hypothetical protein EVAR_8401_1 [Eumeta japonica]|uniref:PiggyBac transposable element-derived protein domain-containing protein n=1 Tax=Eumeta variegata TaxID=151549 RepID=A0A4C1WCL6_EUMVA|nr:hypothetical protein EVAR_8401_1 [Eumeta japonica]